MLCCCPEEEKRSICSRCVVSRYRAVLFAVLAGVEGSEWKGEGEGEGEGGEGVTGGDIR